MRLVSLPRPVPARCLHLFFRCCASSLSVHWDALLLCEEDLHMLSQVTDFNPKHKEHGLGQPSPFICFKLTGDSADCVDDFLL